MAGVVTATEKLYSNKKPSSSEKVVFWTVYPKPKACDACKGMEGIKFEEEPERPHPNCKCEIKKYEYKPGTRTIVGTVSGSKNARFAGLGYVDIELSNIGVALLPGVRITSNLAGIQERHIPLGSSQVFDFNILTDTHVKWDIWFEVFAENTTIKYIISYKM
jgi:hypothetical protein